MKFLLELREGLAIAWDAIRANKMRSVLTTLGIIIGVVTVTLMGTAIDGLNRAFMQSISILGADTLYASRIGWFIDSYEEWIKAVSRPRITLRQVEAVADQLTLAVAVAPFVEGRAPVQYKERRASGVTLIGTTEQFALTSGSVVESGRFLLPEEVAGGRPVCVIGAEVATNLFRLESAIGKRIKVGQARFEVVGVLARQGSFLGAFSLDNQVIIPVTQFITEFWHDPDFQIQVKVGDLTRLDDAKEELRGVLRKVRRLEPGEPDNFAINQQEGLATRFKRVSRTIAAVGLFITGLALFVGGIGIMNIMFVSVAERTREIGIRKAIGAKRRAILIQFLAEAASICLLGGLIALGIAWPCTLLMKRFLPAHLSLPLVGLAIGVSLFTGVVSGFFPAWRAARLDPVEALRNE